MIFAVSPKIVIIVYTEELILRNLSYSHFSYYFLERKLPNHCPRLAFETILKFSLSYTCRAESIDVKFVKIGGAVKKLL